MPVIGHNITWTTIRDVPDWQLGGDYRANCECGVKFRGSKQSITPALMGHLEKQEFLQFRGNR